MKCWQWCYDGLKKGRNGKEINYLCKFKLTHVLFAPPKILNDLQICISMHFKSLIYPMALSHRNVCQKLAPSLCLSRSLPFSDHSAAIPLVPISTILYNVIDFLQRVKPIYSNQLCSYPGSKPYNLCDPRFSP